MTQSDPLHSRRTRLSDADLVKRFLAGDEAAFEEIVRRYRKMVYYTALRVVGGHDDADDVAQKTFLSAFKNLKGFQGKSSLKTWLFRVAMNFSKNRLRDRQRNQGEELAPQTAVYESDVEERMEREGRRRILNRAVETLPPRQREVLRLRVHHELTFAEISEVIGCSVNSAKVNYHHAVKALQSRIAPPARLA